MKLVLAATLSIVALSTQASAMPTHQCLGMSGCAVSPLNHPLPIEATGISTEIPVGVSPRPGNCNDPIRCGVGNPTDSTVTAANTDSAGVPLSPVSHPANFNLTQSLNRLSPGAGNEELMNTRGVVDQTSFQ